MSEKPTYQEKILSLGITIILGIVAAGITFMLVYQLIEGPIGSKPAPNGILAAFAGLMILITLNFTHLRISISEKGVKTGYGIFTKTLTWEQIASCEQDEKNYFYGYGVRLGRYKKEWVWVYNVMKGPRVVVLTKDKKPKGTIFSTKNPQEAINTINAYLN